jgi:uncharacterized membrane protein
MSTNRLEAFSDGVFAVAITLLVLDIKVPEHSTRLGHDLGLIWPHYLAYVVSFITIGIIWINHHAMIGRLRQTDHAILALNTLLLMIVAALPFTTSLMATYLKEGHGDNLAAGIYSASFLAMSIVFATLNWHILFPKVRFLEPSIDRDRRRQIISRGVTGLIPYAIATALAPVSAYLAVAICGAVAGFYALPIASGTERAAT